MQAITEFAEIVIVTLIFSDVVPQLKYLLSSELIRSKDLSVALLSLFNTLFSFQGAFRFSSLF